MEFRPLYHSPHPAHTHFLPSFSQLGDFAFLFRSAASFALLEQCECKTKLNVQCVCVCLGVVAMKTHHSALLLQGAWLTNDLSCSPSDSVSTVTPRPQSCSSMTEHRPIPTRRKTPPMGIFVWRTPHRSDHFFLETAPQSRFFLPDFPPFPLFTQIHTACIPRAFPPSAPSPASAVHRYSHQSFEQLIPSWCPSHPT